MDEIKRKKLFENLKRNNAPFPVRIVAQVGDKEIRGFMYEDGVFEEGETATR